MSELRKRMELELLRSLVGKQIFDEVSGAVLDVRSAVAFDAVHNGRKRTFVVSVATWTEHEATFRARTEVDDESILDGRVLTGKASK